MGGVVRVGRRITTGVRWDQSHLIPLSSHQAPKSYFAHLHFTEKSPIIHLHYTYISHIFHKYITKISPIFHLYFTYISPICHYQLATSYITQLIVDLSKMEKKKVSNTIMKSGVPPHWCILKVIQNLKLCMCTFSSFTVHFSLPMFLRLPLS